LVCATGLLIESGTAFNKQRLHQKKYFSNLMKSLEEVPESVKDLLRMSRGSMEMFQSTQKQLVERLLSEPALEQRVERLMSTFRPKSGRPLEQQKGPDWRLRRSGPPGPESGTLGW
jgi:hypothetical protein